MGSIEIRSEQAGDEPAVYKVTADAFRGRPYAGGNEQDLLNRLREIGQLALSLVAMDGERLVGQITFSPATLSDGSEPWFALGPVSVAPECQSQGIGSQLIRAGLDEISAQGALGCVLTGNPAYYQRFGFALAPDNVPKEESREFFQLKLLNSETAEGLFAFDAAFYESYRG
ncbi:MAG: N-acetyltransferase [Myxococcota bacterium]|nr:N-acetyltransferase [Myxococcota bacterium]